MSAESHKSAFVLVPGAFCPGAYWRRVTEILQSQGHDVHEIDLPSIYKRDGPLATIYDDADHIKSVVTGFADQGKDVVVAANSYGGFVATEAVKGCTRSEREMAGKPGAQTHLVYIGSLLPPMRIKLRELIGDLSPVDPNSPLEYKDPPPPKAAALICSDLDEEQQKYYGSMFKPQSSAVYSGGITHTGYAHVATTCVVTNRDLAVPPKLMHENVDAAIAEKKGDIRKIVLESDHCAMISHAKEVAEILIHAANDASR